MSFFSDLFKKRSDTTTLDPMLTKEQLGAQSILSQLANTGSYGGVTLGDSYGGSLGNFDMSNTESLAGNKLYDLLQSGTPEGINTARNTLTGLANTQFNPDDPSSGFAAYQRQVERASQGSRDALNRDAAVTGDRFSSRLGMQKADLAAQESDMLATKLAELFNTAQNRSLSAANALTGLETANEGINQGRISSGFQYGGLDRLLKNAEADAKFNEWNRARGEKLKQFDIAGDLFNKNVGFGTMSTTVKQPSIGMSLLGQVSPLAGAYNTAKYGSVPSQAGLSDITGASSGGGMSGLFSLLKSLAIGGV